MSAVATIASKVPNLDPGDSLSTIIRVMAKSRALQLPVVSHGKLVGIVSSRDVLRAVAREESRKTAGDIMTGNIHTIDAAEHTSLVASRLVDEAIGCLPVLRAGKLVGVLTAADLIAHLANEQGAAKKAGVKKSTKQSRPKKASTKGR